ncbi:MAG TPA: phage holin family protein [Verrucomicrobiales bacterium]|nr:phage holin family protein [Verrucomicrobiales bacterium]
MPDPETPSAAPSGSAGIPEATFSALGSAIDFLSLRFDLAQVEAKEAGRAIRRTLLCLIIGVVFLILGYAVFIAALVGLLQRYAHWPWPLTLSGLALIHFLAGFILLNVTGRTKTKNWFASSLAELEKDRSWLDRHRRHSAGSDTPPR